MEELETTETTEESPSVPTRNRGRGIIIVSAIALVLGLGGTVAFFLIPKSKPKTEAASPEKVAKENQPKIGPMVEMRPLVANLDDPEGGRYLKVAIFIEATSEEAKATIEASIVPIRSNALVYLSGLTIKDTVGVKSKLLIAERLQELFEKIVGKPAIKQLYFGEFVVQ
jgi:flagellar basal body-associated protein FliL